jgi:hypothetical protein
MRHLKLLILAALALIAACREEISPLVSAKVTDQGIFAEMSNPKTWALTETQLKLLTGWLQERNTDGSVLLMTPPSPSFVIRLTHADGHVSVIELFSANENWKRAIVVGTAGKYRIQGISSDDRETLLQLVKEKPDG